MADLTNLDDAELAILRLDRDILAQQAQVSNKRVAIAEKKREIKRLELDLDNNESQVEALQAKRAELEAQRRIAADE